MASIEERLAILEERTLSHARSDSEDFETLRKDVEKLWKKLDNNSRVLLGVLVALILNLVAGLVAIAVAVN